MILSIFSSQQIIEKMIIKSVYGYGISVISAFLIYIIIAKSFESKKSIVKLEASKNIKFWVAAQWISTAFLWSQWLIQDFANIFVFLPRKLSLIELILSITLILSIMAYIFKSKGGKIQEIVNKKVNAGNIRSATLIDLCYGIILFIYGNYNSIPMSTTWTFIGVLAGREMAINFLLNKDNVKSSSKLIFKDLWKVSFGLAISVFIVYIIQYLKMF
jgi:hypothetical protein